jgi:hypothetical protein
MNRGEPYPFPNIDLPSTCKVANRVQAGFQARPGWTISNHKCLLSSDLESSNPFAALDAAWLRNCCRGLHKFNAASLFRIDARSQIRSTCPSARDIEVHQGNLATANRSCFLFFCAFFSCAATRPAA